MSISARPITATLLAALLLAACGPTTTERNSLPPLQAVASVDIERYMGTWYEIASFPFRPQRRCTGTTATYSLRDDGQVRVINRCFLDTLQGKLKEADGVARVVDSASKAKLEVSFFRPFWGEYWVIELAPDYRYAVVGNPSRDYLWVLSRSPQMADAEYEGILQRLSEQHQYPIERLQRTLQPVE